MRYQKAKRLVPILELLNSEDRETVLLGISLLANEPIVNNLNKHYRSYISLDYPGFGSNCPKQFKNFKGAAVFKKEIFTTIFNIVDNRVFNLEVLTIISWLYKKLNLKYQSRKLPKYKFESYKGIFKYIYNRDYTSVIYNFYFKHEIKDHKSDNSKDAKYDRLYLMNRRTKRPQRAGRKYNTRSSEDFDILISKLDLKKYLKWNVL